MCRTSQLGKSIPLCNLVSPMGEVEIRVGARFLEENGLELPICPELALRAAGLFPVPDSPGPATLEGTVLRYDSSRPGWEREVVELVCGAVLRQHELPDKHEHRVELARVFDVELLDTRAG
jgi:hypothetical protein